MGIGDPLKSLKDLGDPALLLAEAKKTSIVPEIRKLNSHIHLPPNFSAFSSAEQALEMALAEEIKVLGLTNYYDYSLYLTFAAGALARKIFPLFGLELIILDEQLCASGTKINDPGNPGKMYLCAKGVTSFMEPPQGADEVNGIMPQRARKTLEKIRQNDQTRMREMIKRINQLAAKGGVPLALTESEIVAQIAKSSGAAQETIYLQERHLAQTLQEKLFALVPSSVQQQALELLLPNLSPQALVNPVLMQNEIRSRLMKAGKPCFVEESFINFAEAYDFILQLGGIPCYPLLADGAKPICPFEEPVEALAERLTERGIFFVEVIPLRNDLELLRHYVFSLRKFGFLVVAGTEHNTTECVPLSISAKGGVSLPAELEAIFWEGACVVAAHQFLRLHQNPGYIDERGQLSSGYASAEERIRIFSSLGQRIINALA